MIKKLVFYALVMLGFVQAAKLCPDCDVSSALSVQLTPSALSKNNQSVNLVATLQCPNNTLFWSFGGYTIFWGDGDGEENKTYFGFDEIDHRCEVIYHRKNCNPKPEEWRRNNMSSMTRISASHTYAKPGNYTITIKLTMMQKGNDFSVNQCSNAQHSTLTTHVTTYSTRIQSSVPPTPSVPIDYCAIPKTYSLFSTANLSLNDRVTCTKKDVSKSLCKIGVEKNFTIGVSGQADEVHVNGKATLRNRSVIHSGLWAKTIEQQDGASYTKKGTTTTFDAKTSVKSVSYANGSVVIEAKKTKSFEPGTYGDVAIRKDGVLELSSDGVYFFRSLMFEYGSVLKIKGSGVKEIYTNSFTFRGQQQGANASKLLVGVTGSSTVFVENAFTGSVWAPNAPIVIGQYHYKTFTGSYLGKGITIHQDSKINYVEFTKNGECK